MSIAVKKQREVESAIAPYQSFAHKQIIDRLTEYEETLLSPAQIIQLKERVKELERKTGRWVYDPNAMDWGIGAWVCSECHCKNANLFNGRCNNPYFCAGSNYCPNCGARMVEYETN